MGKEKNRLKGKIKMIKSKTKLSKLNKMAQLRQSVRNFEFYSSFILLKNIFIF